MKVVTLTIFFACFVAALGGVQQKYEGYVFVYFTGNTLEGENIYIAVSKGNDALNWVELNGGKPILRSNKGTKGLRDPFIIRSESGDKFYMVATDLSIGTDPNWGHASSQGSKYLEIWESADLVNWSEQRHMLVSPPNAGCSWAPEAHFDKTIGKYIVYWASTLYKEGDDAHTGGSYHRLLYATTDDFVHFSQPQIWQDSGSGRIDSTVFEENDVFYRFTVGDVDGCHDIFQESSTNLTASFQAWKTQTACLSKKIRSGYVEGPTCFKSNPGDVNGEKYYLFVDEAGGRGYIPVETDDIANPAWKMPSSFKLPTRARHGTVMPVTAEELARLTATLK